MDHQNRPGGKTGGGGVASSTETNKDRRKRLMKLAMETLDLQKDPYFMKNHLGSYECKLCLTIHTNEGSYLTHTQGKRHQSNLAVRAAKEARNAQPQPALRKPRVETKKFIKIGRPGYQVTKQKYPETGQLSLLFQINYPEIANNVQPHHRFMSSFEQRIEPPEKKWQYLLFAAEPYETISFKVPSHEVDRSKIKFWTHWNTQTKQFYLQFAYKIEQMKPEPLMKPPPPFIPPPFIPPPPQHNMIHQPGSDIMCHSMVPPPPIYFPEPPPMMNIMIPPPPQFIGL